MQALESSIQGDLSSMLTNGLISRTGTSTTASRVDSPDMASTQKHSLKTAFRSAFKALESAAAHQEAQARVQEDITLRGPRF